MEKLNIYLIPNEDCTYSACIASKPPTGSAIFITEEGSYPVQYYVHRYDVFGNKVVETNECATREELIESLNWDGKCYRRILELWKYNFYKTDNDTIAELFWTAYVRCMDITREETDTWEELFEDYYDDSDGDNNFVQKDDSGDVVMPF